MNELALLETLLLVGALLFAIGMVGLIARRNVIVMFLSAELMLQGISVSLVGWSRFHNNFGGQVLVIFIIAVAACEAAIALALCVMLFTGAGNLDVAVWQSLREDNQPRHVDEEIPPPEKEESRWPTLAPAGNQPVVDPEKTRHRAHV